MMESSADLIPFRIMLRDCPLGEKPSSKVAEAEMGVGAENGVKEKGENKEKGPMGWVRIRKTRASKRNRQKGDFVSDFI